MERALELAREAAELDEVPVGAVIVRDGEIIAEAKNARERGKCATHHAEILAIEAACRALGGWRLPGTTLYVSLEPCAMCAGAIINARIPNVVYAASDLRFGALGSLIDLSEIPFNHKFRVVRGVMKEDAENVISAYFRAKRVKIK
ncbi:MAG: nucleoside deaminase [Clostridia bacterium]|nr:nucleoside deaminase [Clostridia bacterium]MBQ8720133.1 nucleoside deaminase [Clostridia bacterium]